MLHASSMRNTWQMYDVAYGKWPELLDNTAGNPPAGVARGVGLEIVFLRVDDDGATNNAVRRGAVDDDTARHNVYGSAAGIIKQEVTEVAGVSCTGRAMFDLGGIEMSAGAHAVSRRAIALVMDMNRLVAAAVAHDISRDAHTVSYLREL